MSKIVEFYIESSIICKFDAQLIYKKYLIRLSLTVIVYFIAGFDIFSLENLLIFFATL